MEGLSPERQQNLLQAGAEMADIKILQAAFKRLKLPAKPTRETLASDSRKAREIYRAGEKILNFWPPRAERSEDQAIGAENLKASLRSLRNAFARTYAELIYRKITNHYQRFVRADELVYRVAEECPGLCPARQEAEAEAALPLSLKEGIEIAQGDFLSHVFSLRVPGLHLIHSMMRPLPRSLELRDRFLREGRMDLGKAQLERRGTAGYLFFNNLRHLNAEDHTTVEPLETAVDLVLLDPEIKAGILRGNPMTHPKYRGRRVFSAGLNLTYLYHGRIPFLFFVVRDMGFVNKIHRGLAGDDFDPEGPESTQEKPWIAAVESFAIGGGCQLLLVVDYVVAEENAYFNLPAQKEGIIPGISPLRFSRFVGERIAQEGILFGRTFPVISPEARFMISEVVPGAQMDAAIQRALSQVAGGGLVSAGANRKAIRAGQEPQDLLRRYLALHCRDQADCQFSPGLITNLERNWGAAKRPL